MSLRGRTSGAINGYLKLLRWPADRIVGLLPGKSTGPSAATRVVVDRVDAAARSGLASTIGDDTLTEDAQRRQAAAQERDRALDLRRRAEAQAAEADTRVQEGNRQAAQRRKRADKQAQERRRTAANKERARTRRAAAAESKRTEVNRRQEAEVEERIESETARERLPAVEEQAQALQEREQAARQASNAERLGEAAARAKAERKDEPPAAAG
ncbi:MAG: hypothetical protein M3Z27_06860 [Actinomycetota bacterium]|nr:hypothetical protein [Actinomycetota bacterium]